MNTYTQDFQDTLYTTSFQPFKKAAKRKSNEECKQHSRKGMHKQEWAKVRSGKRDVNRDWEVV